MRATLLHAPFDIRLEQVDDPSIRRPSDAIVRVTACCICGSDLWPYRGTWPIREPRRIGHEFVGVVEEVGSDVRSVRAGSFVIAPFTASDGTCAHCRHGLHTSCEHGASWGERDEQGEMVDAGQGEFVRVPMADGTLVPVAEQPDDATAPALLALSDVMSTGHHAARSAAVARGDTVVVVGDGAVGLCAVLAARRLGAERIIAMSRHASRQDVARAFGATDVVAERGEEGAARVRELLGGIGADAALECVGTDQSMEQAFDSVRPGGRIGYVGVPVSAELSIGRMFRDNIIVGGGVAPARAYIPELLAEVLDGRLDPGAVFDATMPLDDVADGYRAMDERRAIKVLLRP